MATKTALRPPLLGSIDIQGNAASIVLPAMAAAKIDAVKKLNSADGVEKWVQIGLSRLMRDELPNIKVTNDLRWQRAAAGHTVAYLRVQLTDAKAIRVGLNVLHAPKGLELRFIGSNQPTKALASANATELTALKDENGIYWTPITDGEYQLIEFSLPPNAKRDALKFAVDSVSHIFATSSKKFADAKVGGMFGGGCGVDVICAPQALGFTNAKNAVAQLIF